MDENNQRAKRTIAGIILIFMLLEATLYGLDNMKRLKEPENWGTRPVIPYKIDKCLELFNQNPGKLKVVMIGDSMPELAFNPILFDAYFDNKTISYNLALSGTPMSFQGRFISDVVLNRIHPDLVLISTTIYDMTISNDNTKEAEELFSQPMAHFYFQNTSGMDENELLSYNLEKSWLTYRYRSVIFESLLNLNPISDFDKYFIRGCANRTQRMVGNTTKEYINELYAPWALDMEGVNNWQYAIGNLTEKGVQYLIVGHPYNHDRINNPEFNALLDAYPEDRVLDLNGNLTLSPDYLWHNSNHLNSEFGAPIYTRFVSEKLSNVPWFSLN